MSQFALRAFVSVADKAYKSDLAQDAVPIMQDKGMALSSELYSNVLKACGKNESYGNCEKYAWNAAMEALVQTKQLDKILALANKMKNYRLKWSLFTYLMVVLALIRNGSIEEARQVLHTKAKRTKFIVSLTNIIATKLLETMANHNRIDDCLEMLDSFKELLKPTARVAAFRALIAAMKFEVVMNVIDRVRKQGKYISIEDYKKIQECFEHDENWRLTIQLLPSVTRDSFG
ncbi:unnamed protein product [Peronospora farinosa]|nr:unnamed protein product [Peronospora farinosa]